MAWVRYDDQLPMNAKVTAALLEDPGVMSLHLMANTWTNTTKTPGYVPPTQPLVLLIGQQVALKWADILVRTGLWHTVDGMCAECTEEYQDYDLAGRGGWVFHNAGVYRPPGRERLTPGTPADVSRARAEAGRRGGLASAARRAAEQANSKQTDPTPDFASPDAAVGDSFATAEPQVNPSNASKSVSKPRATSSNGVTPVPVPVPVPKNQSQGQPLFRTPPSAPRGDVIKKLSPSFRFDEFWSAYPHKRDRDRAKTAWAKIVRTSEAPNSDVVLDEVIAGAGFYHLSREYVGGHPKYPATFLNAGSWRDYCHGPPPDRLPGDGIATINGREIPLRGQDAKEAEWGIIAARRQSQRAQGGIP
jgi:hypothetical protein